MNKQEAYEIARKAEFEGTLTLIENAAKNGEYNRRLVFSNREVINELNKLGFNCGYIKDVDEGEIWNIDWSK